MHIKSLFTDEDAVSPVIGVILMVAITVILAAVIGAFVLGIGSSQEQAPQAQLGFSYDSGGDGGFLASGGTLDDTITIKHEGGDDLSGESLTFNVDGESSENATLATSGSLDAAGSTVTISENSGTGSTPASSSDEAIVSGDPVTVIWEASSGSSTQIIADSQVP